MSEQASDTAGRWWNESADAGGIAANSVQAGIPPGCWPIWTDTGGVARLLAQPPSNGCQASGLNRSVLRANSANGNKTPNYSWRTASEATSGGGHTRPPACRFAVRPACRRSSLAGSHSKRRRQQAGGTAVRQPGRAAIRRANGRQCPQLQHLFLSPAFESGHGTIAHTSNCRTSNCRMKCCCQ